MELKPEHLKDLEEVLNQPVRHLPFIVHPTILKAMKRFGLCADGFMAAFPLSEIGKYNGTKTR